MTQKTPMTKLGFDRLTLELEELKRVKRPEVVRAISEARAHGDLKENAEYHAAKDQQGMIEARINKLEADLSHSQVIDVTSLPVDDRVVFGATVELINVDTDQKVRYQIVGEGEADLKQGKISYNSPIARGVIGKRQGTEVEIETPNGMLCFEIAKVEYL
jgi:transcription elongation factor GreA